MRDLVWARVLKLRSVCVASRALRVVLSPCCYAALAAWIPGLLAALKQRPSPLELVTTLSSTGIVRDVVESENQCT
jgi:hypothetical protein